jgi:acetyltransferase
LLLLDDLRGRGVAVPELAASTQAEVGELLPPLTYQRNPVDTGRPGPAFAGVLRAVAADPGVDVVAAYALHEPDALDLAAAVDAARPAVPLVVGVGGAGPDVIAARRTLIDRGIPVAADPTGVAAAVGALLADAARIPRLHDAPELHERRIQPIGLDERVVGAAGQLGDGGHAGAGAQGPELQERHIDPIGSDESAVRAINVGLGPWDEAAAKDMLDALGVATPPRRVCDGRADAQRALAELGGPVAVKLLDAAVLHKTEVGGVRLGVRTPEELDAALDAIGAERVLVEAMAPDGVDLVVGARRDPVFGPVVLVGIGGTVAEALADVAVRVAPLTPDAAAAMVEELAGRALLDGWRGGPVLDRAALGRFVAALGELLIAHPHLQDVEVNPLRVTADGLVALDAVITAETEVSDAHPHP